MESSVVPGSSVTLDHSPNQNVIQRQYDEVIAQHYDLDPQSVTSDSLDLAIRHLREAGWFDRLDRTTEPMRVLDLGMGTGMFFEKMIEATAGRIKPYGVDLSSRMIGCAERKIPGLEACVDDAANFDKHFGNDTFDLICTHFVTGFVPMDHLAPRIWKRLKPGGCWSFVGGTSQGYRALQQKAGHPLLQLLFGGRKLQLDDLIVPVNQAEVARRLSSHQFEILSQETFEPPLHFGNFDEFMEFAYTGGWLTPFIEAMGLQKARKPLRGILNRFVFPIDDHHNIVLVVARKPE